MPRHRAAAVAVVVILSLAGCAALVEPRDPESPSTRSATPSQTSSPTPTASADSSVLFTITADLRSAEGTRIHVTETAYTSSAISADARTAWAAAECDAQYYDLDPAAVVRIDARAEVVGGPAPDPEYLLALDGGQSGSSPTSFIGDWRVGQAYCADGYLSMPGTATGWTGVDSADGWTRGRWGVGADTGAGDATRTMTATLCTLDRGLAAEGVTLPAGWDTADTRYGCYFGVAL